MTDTEIDRRTACEKRVLRLARISRMGLQKADRDTLYRLLREALDELYAVSDIDGWLS